MSSGTDQLRDYIRRHGLRYTLERAIRKFSEQDLKTYHKLWLSQRADDTILARQREEQPDGRSEHRKHYVENLPAHSLTY